MWLCISSLWDHFSEKLVGLQRERKQKILPRHGGAALLCSIEISDQQVPVFAPACGCDCLSAAMLGSCLPGPFASAEPCFMLLSLMKNPSRWSEAVLPYEPEWWLLQWGLPLPPTPQKNYIIFTVSSSHWDFPNSSHTHDPAVRLGKFESQRPTPVPFFLPYKPSG